MPLNEKFETYDKFRCFFLTSEPNISSTLIASIKIYSGWRYLLIMHLSYFVSTLLYFDADNSFVDDYLVIVRNIDSIPMNHWCCAPLFKKEIVWKEGPI